MCEKPRPAATPQQDNEDSFALTALKFFAVDVLCVLVKAPRKHKYPLVISDRLVKLVRNVLLMAVTAKSDAREFVAHWVMSYGPPRFLLSDDGKQPTSGFFNMYAVSYGSRTYSRQRTGLKPVVKCSGIAAQSWQALGTMSNSIPRIGTCTETSRRTGTALRSIGSRTVRRLTLCSQIRPKQ